MQDERLPLDTLSNLPQNIIQLILTNLPIRDAFRTSILSHKWRYQCANISKLEFNDALLKDSTSIELADKYKLLINIYSILLLHHAPILEFSLCISQLQSCCDIDRIIIHLSRNTTLEKFTLCMALGNDHILPSSFFSLLNLTHLKLQNCVILPNSSFSRFGKLTSLQLYDVVITKSKFMQFLSFCPQIKNFTLIEDDTRFLGTECSNFVDLFQCLPLIEHLEMNRCPVKLFALGVIPHKFTNAIVHLNFLGLFGLSFAKEDELSSPLLLIASSPNLKKIKLEMCIYNLREEVSQDAMNFFDLRDDSYNSLDHLRELEITNFIGIKPGMDFMKFILAKSLMLEKVRLVFCKGVDFQNRFLTLEELLELPRVSSRARILFGR